LKESLEAFKFTEKSKVLPKLKPDQVSVLMVLAFVNFGFEIKYTNDTKKKSIINVSEIITASTKH
jgi:hypothetical protein